MLDMINQSIWNLLTNNHIDYSKLKDNFLKHKIFDEGHHDINVIIPVRGRTDFMNPMYQSFKKAFENSNLKITYTIVEISDKNEHENFCIKNKINYVWIKTEPNVLFNKCLALNVGAMFTVSCDAFIFHDIDCLMQSDFFIKLEENINNKKAKAIQCFHGRRVLYLDSVLTEKVIDNEIDIDTFDITTNGISLPENIGAPGGSIYTTKDLFFDVGGYDPELFQANAPEDIFYWEKISMLDTMHICDNPPIDLFHMSHPITHTSNPRINEMLTIYDTFKNDDKQNKLELIMYKKNLISEQIFNHISIVISTRNSVDYVTKCLDSAISQDYPNYEIIFLDAQSNDGTYEKAKEFEPQFEKIKILQNKVRKYQGENIRIGTEMSPEKSIIITLDGDDWFPHSNVLSKINSVYNETGCWMTYGTYVEHPYRDVSNIYHEYPLEVRTNKTFRQHRWLASHLRTFRRELFLKINPEDMKDPTTNDYVSMAPDLSFQFPMLEMCDVDKSKYIPDILYVYNRENPMNESKINQDEINRIEQMLRSKKPYETVKSLYNE